MIYISTLYLRSYVLFSDLYRLKAADYQYNPIIICQWPFH